MLAIYLHHDSSVLTNVFCTQALCADSVVSFLSENFVTFGWDLTLSSNKSRYDHKIKAPKRKTCGVSYHRPPSHVFPSSSSSSRALSMVTNHFGSVAAATIRSMDMEKLPLIALVYRLRGTTEIFQIIHGNVTLDELMSRLLTAHDTYTSQLHAEIKDEADRDARNAVKREQDLAFEAAQHADRQVVVVVVVRPARIP